MSCQRAVYQWTDVITTHLAQLSKPQARVLALWSVGMVLARSCALSAVSLFLAQGLARHPNTVRQQLREWCYEAQAKRGKPRQELAVETCFAPLLAWVLSWWVRHEAQRENGWKILLTLQGVGKSLGRSAGWMQVRGERAGPERYWCGAM